MVKVFNIQREVYNNIYRLLDSNWELLNFNNLHLVQRSLLKNSCMNIAFDSSHTTNLIKIYPNGHIEISAPDNLRSKIISLIKKNYPNYVINN